MKSGYCIVFTSLQKDVNFFETTSKEKAVKQCLASQVKYALELQAVSHTSNVRDTQYYFPPSTGEQISQLAEVDTRFILLLKNERLSRPEQNCVHFCLRKVNVSGIGLESGNSKPQASVSTTILTI
jgi:hypothetical protein